jgi:glycosyltransferase involved in cell wall biosynthesis
MKICLDVQSAVVQRAGVGRYTKVLAQHLGRVAPDDEFVFPYFDFKRQGEPFEVAAGAWRPIHWCPGRLVQAAWKSTGFPPYEWFAGPADVYHFPNFAIPPMRKGTAVVTVHDLAFMRYPEFAEDRNVRYLNATMPKTISRAAALITVSEFSAREIVELLDVPRNRIYVVYHGISDTFAACEPAAMQSVLASYGIDRPYILTVGTVEPRKNLPFLIDRFEQLTDFDGCLVIAGGRGWKYEPIFERIRNSPRQADIRYVEYVDDTRLPALYTGAQAFVLPSLYEGFGFPPLEAMACGTPVVSSAGGSLAEVLGHAAIVLDTFEPDRWNDALRRVISDSALREDLRAKGRAHAATFTWESAARATHAVYRQVSA